MDRRLNSEFQVHLHNHRIEVWPRQGHQVPVLPLMSEGQTIHLDNGAVYSIIGVAVEEHRAVDESQFDYVYVWCYDTVKVKD